MFLLRCVNIDFSIGDRVVVHANSFVPNLEQDHVVGSAANTRSSAFPRSFTYSSTVKPLKSQHVDATPVKDENDEHVVNVNEDIDVDIREAASEESTPSLQQPQEEEKEIDDREEKESTASTTNMADAGLMGLLQQLVQTQQATMQVRVKLAEYEC